MRIAARIAVRIAARIAARIAGSVVDRIVDRTVVRIAAGLNFVKCNMTAVGEKLKGCTVVRTEYCSHN